ncbi:MAG: ABC transporter ATP-binding protein [Chloroflexaceae bacterium]|nr:ABC transporter ATP-binding protein [Chloroflexaceae bacterium]
MVAGFEGPTSGRIEIGGRDCTTLEPHHRNTAMVFQSYALYPHMTVYQNMAFPLEAQKLRKDAIRQRILPVAEALGIAHLLDRKPRQLSGGQMQRVALGRAIVRRPDVFLLDEPLSNLDATLRIETRAELKRLQRDLAVTTVYVTHDQEEALTLADMLVVMRSGRPEQIGTPHEVYQSPRTTFVGRFIGNPPMNMLACHYIPAQRCLELTTCCLPIPPQFMAALAATNPPHSLVLGFRPEALRLHWQQPNTAYVFPATVYVLEPLGRETLITLNIGDERVKAIGAPDTLATAGVQVWLTVEPSALHLFDGESSVALQKTS